MSSRTPLHWPHVHSRAQVAPADPGLLAVSSGELLTPGQHGERPVFQTIHECPTSLAGCLTDGNQSSISELNQWSPCPVSQYMYTFRNGLPSVLRRNQGVSRLQEFT